jgi:predicted MFS family arabinose efflux permease
MRLGVLRHREFRLVFIAQGVSVLGDRMVSVALAFAVLGLGGTASEVGLVLACRMLPMVACLLAGGVVADRVSRRAVMVTADLVRLGSQGLMGALVVAGAGDVWSIAVLAGVGGAATGFFNPASTGLLPALVPPEEVQPANGLRATAMAGGEIAGPVIAGVVVAGAGPGWAILADAATFAVSAACLTNLRLPQRLPREAATSFAHDLRDGWKAFRSRTWVWTAVAIISVHNLLWGAWSALGPVVARDALGGAAAWGSVLAALGVGALLGGLAAVRVDPQRPLVVFAVTGTLMAIPLACLAAAAPVAVVAAGALVAGAAMMFGNSLWESSLQRHVPAGEISRVSAYDWFGSMAFSPFGLAMWGPIAAVTGVAPALWIAAAAWLVASAGLLAVPEIRRMTAFPATALATSRGTR